MDSSNQTGEMELRAGVHKALAAGKENSVRQYTFLAEEVDIL